MLTTCYVIQSVLSGAFLDADGKLVNLQDAFKFKDESEAMRLAKVVESDGVKAKVREVKATFELVD